VRDLAAQVTARATTPYDKAKAIEGYLSTLRYTFRIEPPPFQSHGVDHFLFTLRGGYSEYFASAMAVMLRSVGVPARLATGYSTGDKVADKDIYLVTDSHSHGWVEVFFPEYGWIPFEPTPGKSIPQVGAPPGDAEAMLGEPAQRLDECDEDPEDCDEFGLGFAPQGAHRGGALWGLQGLLLVLVWLLSALGSVVLLGGGGWLFWRRYMMLTTEPGLVFRRLCLLGALSSAGPLAHQTPFQYRERLGEVLPAHRSQVSAIVDTYVRTLYGRKALTQQDRDGLSQAWLTLRMPLLLRVLRRRNP